jgi:hypothetical protein
MMLSCQCLALSMLLNAENADSNPSQYVMRLSFMPLSPIWSLFPGPVGHMNKLRTAKADNLLFRNNQTGP